MAASKQIRVKADVPFRYMVLTSPFMVVTREWQELPEVTSEVKARSEHFEVRTEPAPAKSGDKS